MPTVLITGANKGLGLEFARLTPKRLGLQAAQAGVALAIAGALFWRFIASLKEQSAVGSERCTLKRELITAS